MNIQIKEIFYFLFIRIPFYILGKYRKNHVKVHWGRGLHNFGDCLQPCILKHYGLTPYYVTSMEKLMLLWLVQYFNGFLLLMMAIL